MDPANVDHFVDVAQRYCGWLEQRSTIDTHSELRSLVALLAELVGHGVLLPDLDPEEGEAQDDVRVPKRITISCLQYYWSIFDPLEGVEDATPPSVNMGHIASDVGEIYDDIADGLVHWRLGSEESRREAVWRWRFGFEYHWGAHATSAINALYWALRR